jgi:hypothetical protein
MNVVEEELQRLFHSTLAGNGAIMAIANKVYDRVPDKPYGAKTAYISFGPVSGSEDDADCIVGSEITMQIDVWSKADGAVEAKRLTNLVRKALHHKSLELNDNALVDTHVALWRVFRDQDGITTHGVVTVTCLVEEND